MKVHQYVGLATARAKCLDLAKYSLINGRGAIYAKTPISAAYGYYCRYFLRGLLGRKRGIFSNWTGDYRCDTTVSGLLEAIRPQLKNPYVLFGQT